MRSQQWSARGVPGLRAGLVAGFAGQAARLRSLLDTRGFAGWAGEQSSRAGRAELFWATADMAAAAMDAAADVPGFAPADLPCPDGLLLFAAPLPPLRTPVLVLRGGREWAGEVPVWGLWWHGHDPATTRVEVIARRGDLPGEMVAGSELQPVVSMVIPRDRGLVFDAAGVRVDDGRPMPRDGLGVLALLSAASVMMRQPTLTDRRRLDARSGRAPVQGRTRESDRVTLVDLRPLRHVPGPDTDPDTGRRYRHRWVVRGHWRQQPYGPGNTLRRLQYVEPYIKGPPDAPLLATEKVMVWRR